MLKYCALFVFIIIGSVFCQTWLSRARLVDPQTYYSQLMQETIYEIERRSWSNLKLNDITHNLNAQMYHWLVSGTATYTNGFVVSIQKIDLTNFQSSFGSRTVEGTNTTVASVAGRLNLRDIKIGYDVVANLTGEELQHYTGTFIHSLIQIDCRIERNLNLNTTSASVSVSSVSGGLQRMFYLPADSLTEVLSRDYRPGDIWNGVASWTTDIIRPIMEDIAINKLTFPEVCFNHC